MTQKTTRRYLRCNRCKETALMTEWQPPPGIDPLLWEFKCIACEHTFYLIIPLEERWDYKN